MNIRELQQFRMNYKIYTVKITEEFSLLIPQHN
jgi:hypothetical protein